MLDLMLEDSLTDCLLKVRQDIERCAKSAGRDAREIRLIAVSKTRSLQEVRSVAALGQQDFGENTVQDAMTKIPHLSNQSIEWHYIGHLQSKKAGKIPGFFQWIHSVDSIKLAQKLSTAMQHYSANARLNCLIQVNVSAEDSKSGLLLNDVRAFLQEVISLQLPGLSWRGLMTIGVQGDELQTRRAFSQLRVLQQSCKAEFSLPDFDQLSMGMSGDYCLAIKEGATMVRVGT
ncbi:MAG: YggS family pyridoxal phosphate-dependent enzyme, partial [Gammaproteobacteria bacterium]|nr:YggS family pyridoxal phosphate-dependent enzyme [Gammaproteobacteria bacterium]